MQSAIRRHPFRCLALLAVAAVTALAGAGVFGSSGSSARAQAQPGRSSMAQRLDQVIRTLAAAESCQAAQAAIDDGMEILYGGLRPLPSKDLMEQTKAADQAISAAELRLAEALDRYALAGGCADAHGRALDLKLFIEQMNEVAAAVGEVTSQCGNGDSLDRAPCDGLRPLIDEATGEELPPTGEQRASSQAAAIRPGYSVKLRSPFVPPWFGRWQHDVRLTEPLARGECAAVFKESRGLMVRLRFERIIVVTDPWVSVFSVPRGTPVAIWRLEWVPSQYGKTWNFCNLDGRAIRTTVTQRIKQDHAVNFFWRFYPKDP